MKSWKDEFCDTCDNEVGGLCRAVPPCNQAYTEVIFSRSNTAYQACKLWEPKREPEGDRR